MILSCQGIGLVAMTFIAAITHQLHGFELLLHNITQVHCLDSWMENLCAAAAVPNHD